jgi:hypothetical protein
MIANRASFLNETAGVNPASLQTRSRAMGRIVETTDLWFMELFGGSGML